MAWPTDDLVTDQMDSDGDSPLLARLQLLAAINKIKAILGFTPAAAGPIATSGITGTVNTAGTQEITGWKWFSSAMGATFSGPVGVGEATQSGHAARLSQVFGSGSAWIVETANRQSSITYTNTTSKPIAVVVLGQNYSAPGYAQLYGEVNAALIMETSSYAPSGDITKTGICLIVQPGATYIVHKGLATTITKWSEFK